MHPKQQRENIGRLLPKYKHEYIFFEKTNLEKNWIPNFPTPTFL